MLSQQRPRGRAEAELGELLAGADVCDEHVNLLRPFNRFPFLYSVNILTKRRISFPIPCITTDNSESAVSPELTHQSPRGEYK